LLRNERSEATRLRVWGLRVLVFACVSTVVVFSLYGYTDDAHTLFSSFIPFFSYLAAFCLFLKAHSKSPL